MGNHQGSQGSKVRQDLSKQPQLAVDGLGFNGLNTQKKTKMINFADCLEHFGDSQSTLQMVWKSQKYT